MAIALRCEFLFEKFPDVLCDGRALVDFAVSQNDNVVDFVLFEETPGHFELERDGGQIIREDGQAVVKHEEAHHDLSPGEEMPGLFDIHFEAREIIFIPSPEDNPVREFHIAEGLQHGRVKFMSVDDAVAFQFRVVGFQGLVHFYVELGNARFASY